MERIEGAYIRQLRVGKYKSKDIAEKDAKLRSPKDETIKWKIIKALSYDYFSFERIPKSW